MCARPRPPTAIPHDFGGGGVSPVVLREPRVPALLWVICTRVAPALSDGAACASESAAAAEAALQWRLFLIARVRPVGQRRGTNRRVSRPERRSGGVPRGVSTRSARRRDACVAAALGAPSTGHSKRAGGRSGDGIVSGGELLGADGALDAHELAAASRRAAWAARDLAARSGARAARARSRGSRGGVRPRRRIRPVDRRKWRRLGRRARRARSTGAATARRCSGACGACVRTRRRRASWLRGRRGDRIGRLRCTSQAGTAVRRMRVQVAER